MDKSKPSPLRKAISDLGRTVRNLGGSGGTATSVANAKAWKEGGADAYMKANPVDDKPISETAAPGSAADKAAKEPAPMNFKKGGVVPRTGLAKVHKGEVVIPAKEAKMADAKKSRAASAMGGGAKKPKAKRKKKAAKIPQSMHIRRAANGGFIANHFEQSTPTGPVDEHALGDMAALQQHVTDNMGAAAPAPDPAAAPVPDPNAAPAA